MRLFETVFLSFFTISFSFLSHLSLCPWFPKNVANDKWMMLFSCSVLIHRWTESAVWEADNYLFSRGSKTKKTENKNKKKNDPLVHVDVERCASFRTCRVGLLLVHGHKLGPLVLGSDPLFPQEPTEQLALVFTARLVWLLGCTQISLGSSARHYVCLLCVYSEIYYTAFISFFFQGCMNSSVLETKSLTVLFSCH